MQDCLESIPPRNLSFWPEQLLIADLQFDSISPEADYPRLISQMPSDDWLLAWLDRATKRRFDPGAYQRIMAMAEKGGDPDLRDVVGFEKNERERHNACRKPISLECAVLTFSRTVTGYGYQYFRTVLFVVFFVVCGAVVFQFAPTADKRRLRYGFAYSFDTFLPLIHLRKLHDEIDITNWVRYYFFVHKLAGWAAGTFLVAALSGLTK